MIALLASTVWLLVSFAAASAPADWRQITSIYQVVTDRFARTDNSTTAPCDLNAKDYCGGTWQGIINQLDYIQGMGFGAIWISPVIANTPKGYHGYWGKDFYQENPYFGTADDLKALSSALHARKMLLMVDVAVNDLGIAGTATDIDWSQYNPFNDPKYFNAPCNVENYDNQTESQICRLYGLPDLNTTDPTVTNLLDSWIKDLVSNFTIDGLRIDAAKHVNSDFWPGFRKAAGVYSVGEVYNGDPKFTCTYEDVLDGVANYPIYFPLTAAFQNSSGDISRLVDEVASVKASCKDPSLFTTFIENADLPRFASLTNDTAQTKSAMAFSMLSDGIPVVQQGQEQHLAGAVDPYNREAVWLTGYKKTDLYDFTALLNSLRRQAISQNGNYTTSAASVVFNDTNTITIMKGVPGAEILSVLSNEGSNGTKHTLTIPKTAFKPNDTLIEVQSCATLVVGANGSLAVPMAGGQPMIYTPATSLGGSKICAQQQTVSSTTGTGKASAADRLSIDRFSTVVTIALTTVLFSVLSHLVC